MASSTQLVPTNGNGIARRETVESGAVVARDNLPAKVKSGISDLLIAFPAGMAQVAEDRVRFLKIYAEAVEGFEFAIVAYALKRLRFHNPRNPFPPTPQDVFELCKNTRANWRCLVDRYYFKGKDWANGEDWGPAPDEPGCYIPGDTIIVLLREALDRWGSTVESGLVDVPQVVFERIPHVAFLPGQRDRIVVKRKEKEAAKEQERKEREYLESLPPDLRAARWDVICSYMRSRRAVPPEEEVIALAKKRLAEREVGEPGASRQ